MKQWLDVLRQKINKTNETNKAMDDEEFKASHYSFFSGLRQRIQTLYRSHPQRFIVIVLLAWIGLVGGGIAYIISHQHAELSAQWSDEQQQTALMMTELQHMGEQLHTLDAPTRASEFQSNLRELTQHIASIQKNLLATAKTSDMDRLFAQLDSLKTYLADMENRLGHTLSEKKYVDPKELPFDVIAIDVIAQLPFVSVDYQHLITPLTLGDSLAGWKIMAADYGSQTVEFQNQKNQLIKINITPSMGERS